MRYFFTYLYLTHVLRSNSSDFSVFKDKLTPSPFIEEFEDPEAKAASKPDHIYMDCMGFGMGNSCLQLTFQACNIDEAKLLYDQLAPVCPIMVKLLFSFK